MSKKSYCWICGTEHDYCPTCDKTHGWKYVACSPRCYQIYLALVEYNSKVADKKQSADNLAHCGINQGDDLSWLLPPIAQTISEIINEKEIKPTKKSKLL